MARQPQSILWALLILGVSPRAMAAAEASPEFGWPLESRTRAISGTFMEPRSRHYHSGLDIRTEGRTGLKVLAPADGWVSRVRVSPEGYGKAVYLSLADGRTLVFAHLSHFADRLQAEVAQAQSKSGVYEQDLRFRDGQLPFAAGELLALSGATGTGAPHLHVEVRDAGQRPLNPLTNGFSVPDREPPRIRALRLAARDGHTRIEGRAQDHVFEPEATVTAAGRLGLQVEVLDTTDANSHTLMPLGVEVSLDGEVVYRLEQQSFDFAQGRQMRVEIVPDPARQSRWLRAYRHRANDLPDRRAAVEDATFDVPADGVTHRVDLRTWDAAGNESKAGFWLHGARPPVMPQAAAPRGEARPGPWSVQLDAQEAVLQIRVAGPLEDPSRLGAIRLEVDVAGRSRPLRPEWSLSGRELCAALEYEVLESGPVGVRVVDRSTAASLARTSVDLVLGGDRFQWTAVADGRLALNDVAGNGLFEGGAAWAEVRTEWPRLPDGTARVLGPWEVSATAAFREGVGVAVRVPDGIDRKGLGLFLREASGKWTLLGGEIVQTQDGHEAAVYLRGELDAVGTVAVLRDTDAPYLGPFTAGGKPLEGVLPLIHPRERRDWNGVTLPRWPSLELPLTDAGAGLAAAAIVAELDGRPFAARWDPEDERLYFDFDPDPGEGVHRARVVATDRLGNSRSTEVEFELRDF